MTAKTKNAAPVVLRLRPEIVERLSVLLFDASVEAQQAESAAEQAMQWAGQAVEAVDRAYKLIENASKQDR
jgi:hypothetical protein